MSIKEQEIGILPMDGVPEDLITAKRAGEILMVESGTVITWAKQGKLRAWKAKRRYMFSEADVWGLFKLVEPAGRPAPEEMAS